MCQRLMELTASMRVYATAFDASLLSCADAAVVVKEAAAVEHMAATVKALAAARAAETQSWKRDGYRSAEDELARRTGSSVAGAREALALGRRLAEQPEVADAARHGDLSPAQAAAISDAVAADPTAAPQLVGAAGVSGSLADLKDQCAQVKANTADLEARRAAIHRRRYLRTWTDQGGEWYLSARGNPEAGAQIMAALGPLTDETFRAARRQGHREHPDAYRFDALVQLAVNATTPSTATDTAAEAAGPNPAPRDVSEAEPPAGDPTPEPDAAPCAAATRPGQPPDANTTPAAGHGKRRTPARVRRGAPVKLILRVDLDAFLRGFPVDGETCDLVGHGPISMSAVADIVNNGDAFIAAILTKGHQLLGVAHLGRKPTAYQRSAIEWLHPTCAAQGCPATATLEIDHRNDWSQTHVTILDWLDALCHHHHALKTNDGWALVNGIGKRPLVAPNDPRHPNQHAKTTP